MHESTQHDSNPSKSIAETVDALADGYATVSDLETLSQQLKGNKSALREYVEHVGLHSALDWVITSREPFEQFDSPPIATPVQPGPAAASTSLLAPLLGIAATVALAFGMAAFWAYGPSGDVVNDCAAITNCSADAKWSVLDAKGAPAMRSDLAEGATIHLTAGDLLVNFKDGAEVNLTAPAIMQVAAPDRAIAVRGKLTATVNEEAIGFSIDTPHAQVVDLGTQFGMEVDDLGQTDVVVFEGEVDLSYGPVEHDAKLWKRRTMRTGEAVRVDGQGGANRIVSIKSDRFNVRQMVPTDESLAPTISDVRDNIRSTESWNYYEVVLGGMREDARAYVDRVGHEWNGLDTSGMPSYLLGGDYVRMFNNDKWAKDYELEISLARPATLYVLFDDRSAAPDWLTENFEDTGDNIGLDRGPFTMRKSGVLNEDFASGVGPGMSVEDTLSVWRRRIDHAGVVRIGGTQSPHISINMYGVVAVPDAPAPVVE